MVESAALSKLRHEHEAIRAQVKILRQTAAEACGHSAALSPEDVSQLERALGYFRDGIREHIRLDEVMEFPRVSASLARELGKQHHDIQKEIDRVLSIVRELQNNNRTLPEDSEYASQVAAALDRVSKLVMEHTELEDQLIADLDKKV